MQRFVIESGEVDELEEVGMALRKGRKSASQRAMDRNILGGCSLEEDWCELSSVETISS